MREYETEILEQYEIEVKSTRKIRGAFFCDTDQGTMLLKESTISDRRARFLYELLSEIAEEGYPNVDIPFAAKEGTFVSTSRDGVSYMLKHWFYGRECDVRREQDVLEAVKNLAQLHQNLYWKQEWESENLTLGRHLKEEFLCHNRELKKVRAFMRKKVNKGSFEYLFLQNFDRMFEPALLTVRRLEESGYEELYRESIENGCMIHGDYNYHNVLFLSPSASEGKAENYSYTPSMATTNFEHVRVDVQVQDLYYFLRKVMEKHRWNELLGKRMLEVYSAVHPLKKAEKEYLALKLAYPEKFWKIANSYYHSNKAWIPEKDVEKLKQTILQSAEKERFLENVFDFSFAAKRG